MTVTVHHGGVGGILMSLHVRLPVWTASESVTIGLNENVSYAVGSPGGYVELTRTWHNGE